MTVRKLARLFIALIATGVGLTEANAQTEFPPAYNNQAHYAVGDLVTDYGNIYRCETAVTKPYLDPSKTYANWELFYVRSNTTIPIGVGQTFPSLAIAWNYVRNARVATAAYLHLNIVTTGGSLNESFSTPLNLDMDTGAQVSIIGDNSGNIQLNFLSSSGLTIDTSHCLGAIGNISLLGSNHGIGIDAESGASISNLYDINIDGFSFQIYAIESANLIFSSDIVLTNGLSCVYADVGSSLTFSLAALTATSGSGGSGISASRGSRILAQQATVQGGTYGALSSYGSVVDVSNSSFTKLLKRLRVISEQHTGGGFMHL